MPPKTRDTAQPVLTVLVRGTLLAHLALSNPGLEDGKLWSKGQCLDVVKFLGGLQIFSKIVFFLIAVEFLNFLEGIEVIIFYISILIMSCLRKLFFERMVLNIEF